MSKSWVEVLASEKEKDYFKKVLSFTMAERNRGKKIYPPKDLVFNAFKLTSFQDLKVVILGQDPYHGHGQAEGLSFSVPAGITPPPSLKNIFKELENDLQGDFKIPSHGHLAKWAEQGVLLLNSVLTVEEGRPGSHAGLGWETFTDFIIKSISDNKEHVVFLLWGNYAKAKAELINSQKHTILSAPHPSPFSVHGGFFGCKHFSQTNEALKLHRQTLIDWQL